MLLTDEEAIGGLRIKLLDFGIAKMFSEDSKTGNQTSIGERQPGTPAYMAPEQCSGTLESDADPAKMDVYACGVIFYQLLGGRLPLWSPNKLGMMALAMSKEPDPLLQVDSTLPPDLAQLVDTMLHKDPKLRPTMEQVRERLKSRREVVRMRATMEIDALAPAPHSEGSSIAPTMDASELGQAKATPSVSLPARPSEDRSTEPRRAGAAEEVLSSAARGIGQQMTGQETRARQERRRRFLGMGAAALLLGVSGLASWRVLRAPEQTRPAAAPHLTSTTEATNRPPAPDNPASQPEAPGAPGKHALPEPETVTTTAMDKPRHGRSKGACTAVEVTSACVHGALSDAQKTKTVSALREALNSNPKAPLKFCNNHFLAVTTAYEVRTAKGMGREVQDNFMKALRAFLRVPRLPGEVEIRCQ